MVGRDFSHDQPFLLVIPNSLLAFNLPLLALQTQLLAKRKLSTHFLIKEKLLPTSLGMTSLFSKIRVET